MLPPWPMILFHFFTVLLNLSCAKIVQQIAYVPGKQGHTHTRAEKRISTRTIRDDRAKEEKARRKGDNSKEERRTLA